MATISGSVSLNPTKYAYYAEWSESDVNIVNNTSVVTVNVYVQKIGNYNSEGSNNSNTLYIDGQAFTTSGLYIDMNPETTPRLVASGSKTITHNSDGSKSINISCSGSLPYGNGYGPQSGSLSSSVTLTTIPRAASITSALSHTIGNDLAYTLSNPGGLYVKLVLYVWDGSNWDQVISSNRGTGSSGTISLGSTENNIMYQAMTDTTNRSAILRAYTYSDSGYSTQVGDYQDKNGTIYVNQTTNKPTFTTYTLENVDKTIANTDKYGNVLVSSSTATLLGTNSDKMIKGISKIRAVITAANKMVALNYATAVRYRLLAGSSYKDENYSADSTVNIDLDNATTGNVSVSAYDSRGLITTVSDSFGVITNYTNVSLYGLSFIRDNNVDTGTKLTVSGNYFYGYFGGGTSGVQNTVTAHYRYKETTEAWGSQTWTAITLSDDNGSLYFNDYIDGDLGGDGFDADKSYNIEIRIYDKLTNVIIEGTLNRGTPVMDITKKGVSFGARYDSDEGGYVQILGKNSLVTGWYPAIETWTYDAANRFKISGDYTGIYQVGDKIKLTQTTVKYFRITAISYSSPNTTVTVEAFNLYALANATITNKYFSRIETPLGFPAREKVLYNGSDSASITLSESSAYFNRLLVYYHQDTRKYVQIVDIAGSGVPMTTMSYQGYIDSAYRIRVGTAQISVSGTSVYFYGVGGSYSTDTTSSSAVGFSDVKIIPTIYKVIGIRY